MPTVVLSLLIFFAVVLLLICLCKYCFANGGGNSYDYAQNSYLIEDMGSEYHPRTYEMTTYGHDHLSDNNYGGGDSW